jgi:hypothetical protein
MAFTLLGSLLLPGHSVPSAKRSGPQIRSFETQQIEGVIDERGMLMGSVRLKKLERGPPVFVEHSNLAADNEAFRLQQFQGIDQKRIIVVEAISVTRN